jgi:hypothetical protein
MSEARAYYARAYSREPINQRHMESFAMTCLEWATNIDDASRRQTVVTAARSWLSIARELDRRLGDGEELVDDLRIKLE